MNFANRDALFITATSHEFPQNFCLTGRKLFQTHLLGGEATL